MRWLAVFALMIGLACTASGGEVKVAVPDAAQLKDAEKTIKDIFKDEYAKRGIDDKKALAAKLLQQGLETKDDAASRYVLLKEAVSLAAASGDAETAAKAVDALGDNYEVDAAALKAEALGKIAPAMPDAAKALTRIYLKAIDDAIAADNYDGAVKLCAPAEAAARKTQDVPLAAQVAARAKEARALQADFAKVKAAQATLKEKPDDPEANLAVGKFMCFTKGDWEKGLPLLAKGSDAKLKELAQKDIEGRDDTQEQSELSDGWWTVSEKQSPSSRLIIQVHSAMTILRVLPRLTGLAQAKFEKRLIEVSKESAAVATVLSGRTKENVAGTYAYQLEGENQGNIEIKGDEVKFFHISGTYHGKLTAQDHSTVEINFTNKNVYKLKLVGKDLEGTDGFHPGKKLVLKRK